MKSVSSIRKLFHSKLKSSMEKKGQHGEENVQVKTVINDEYRKAFRTKSYIEICEKIHQDRQIEARSSKSLDDDASSFSSSPPTTDRHDVDSSEYLVELRRETLIIGSSKNHLFLTNYYDVTLEAGRVCELILLHAHHLRDNYRVIRRVINFIEQKPDYKIWSHNQHKRIHRNLESFDLNTTTNPFSSMTKFVELHDVHNRLFDQLTSKKKKKKRMITKYIKRALAISGCTALAVALLLLALHAAVGVAAAGPGLIVSSLALLAVKKKWRRSKRETKRKVEGMEAQIEAAGRGIYVVMNEFETMRQLVQRLHDEMEHWKSAAETSVRTGKKEALKQVVKGFKMHECCFLERLEELEKQICLCFLHINRSRRLLIQQLDKYEL